MGIVSALVANLTTAQGFADLLREIDQHHADVDLLVNAAGVFFPKPFLEY